MKSGRHVNPIGQSAPIGRLCCHQLKQGCLVSPSNLISCSAAIRLAGEIASRRSSFDASMSTRITCPPTRKPAGYSSFSSPHARGLSLAIFVAQCGLWQIFCGGGIWGIPKVSLRRFIGGRLFEGPTMDARWQTDLTRWLVPLVAAFGHNTQGRTPS